MASMIHINNVTLIDLLSASKIVKQLKVPNFGKQKVSFKGVHVENDSATDLLIGPQLEWCKDCLNF